MVLSNLKSPVGFFIFNHHAPPFIFTDRHHVLLCFGPSRPSREARGERPLRRVPALVRSGLRTAVPRLPREQEKRERHQEAVGEVRLSARLPPWPRPFFLLLLFFPTFVFSRSETMKRFVPSSGSVAASRAVRPRVTTPSWASSREEASERRRDQDWPDQGTHGEGCTHILKTSIYEQDTWKNCMQ